MKRKLSRFLIHQPVFPPPAETVDTVPPEATHTIFLLTSAFHYQVIVHIHCAAFIGIVGCGIVFPP